MAVTEVKIWVLLARISQHFAVNTIYIFISVIVIVYFKRLIFNITFVNWMCSFYVTFYYLYLELVIDRWNVYESLYLEVL
jgi:hypothetical protein